MFGGLKERLGRFKKRVGETVQEKAEAPPEEKELAEEKEVVEPGRTGIGEKAKAILGGEFVIDEGDLEDPFWDLEVSLLESDVAIPVIEQILDSVKRELIGQRRGLLQRVDEVVEGALRGAIAQVLQVDSFDFDGFVRDAEKPVNIVFVGVNGTGKTTTIAKLAQYLKTQGYEVVLAAGDTFRAGAIDQLQKHADNIGVRLIKHQMGSDPAAVIYDAVQHARAREIDVVLADTAGRMHTNVNLMDQLRKIYRVTDPDLVIFVDEAIAGNDAVQRAQDFNNAVPINGSVLTKADADAKGGAAISIAYVTGKPILFLGVGQRYDDIVKFDPDWLVDRIFE